MFPAYNDTENTKILVAIIPSTTMTSQLTLWADEKFMIQILAKAYCFFSVWMKRLKLHEAIYNRIEFLINKSIVQETF